jgi:hypothetical protein
MLAAFSPFWATIVFGLLPFAIGWIVIYTAVVAALRTLDRDRRRHLPQMQR